MSIKTYKTLQIIAVCLFALGLGFMLALIPLWPRLAGIFTDFQLTESDILSVSMFKLKPTVGIIASAAYLAISCIHLAVIKASEGARGRLIVSAIVCALLFYVFDTFIIEKLYSAESQWISAQSDTVEKTGELILAYMNLSQIVGTMLPLLTIPPKMLMFVSIGGSVSTTVVKDAASEQELYEAAEAAAEPAITEPLSDEELNSAYGRPSALEPASELESQADDADIYAAYKRPESIEQNSEN